MTEIVKLLDGLFEDPDQTDGYLVLADVLAERGDPRGELITVQHQLSEQPDNKALRSKEAALLGELALPAAELRWHLGFVRSASVELINYPVEQLRELLDHPCCALTTELDVDVACSEYTGASNVQAAINILGERPRPALRGLMLAQKVCQEELEGLPPYSGCEHRRSAFWNKFPRLERLHLGGIELFHTIEHPRLEVLVLDDLPLCPDGRWRLPALRSLDWNADTTTYGESQSDVSFDTFDSLWECDLPGLRDLTLRGHFDGDLLPTFDRPQIRRLVRQLDRLALPESAVIPWDTDLDLGSYLISQAEHLRHLSRLLINCELDALDVKAIHAALPKAEFVEVDPADRNTFSLDDSETGHR